MGSERGPGLLRRPPRGWIPARAFPLAHVNLPEASDETGSQGSIIDTSHGIDVTWEVRVDGREPVRFREQRRGPAWIAPSSVSGKRWYRLRLRGSDGLLKSLGVPGHVDPADFTQLWIDWDAAYEEHAEAWDRAGRVERAIAGREGVLERVANRLLNPFEGRLRPGEEALVEEEIARRYGRGQASLEAAIAAGRAAVPPEEEAEHAHRIAESHRLLRVGRIASAVVVSQAATGRNVAGMPEIQIALDVDDDAGTRRLTYSHIWGRVHAEQFGAGKRIDVRIDPDDPRIVELL